MAKHLYYFRPSALNKVLRPLSDSYRVVALDRDQGTNADWIFPAVLVANAREDDPKAIERLAPKSGAWRLIYFLEGHSLPKTRFDGRLFAMLPSPTPQAVLARTIESAFDTLRLEEESRRTAAQLHLVATELETLNKIGIALSTERSPDALLELILTKSREITGCDAGSLYLVEEDPEGAKHLVFRLTQSDSHSVPFRQFTLPIDTRSIAGYAAATGKILNIKDAYRIRNLPFRVNRDFDEKFGYRTKSMLTVPMKNQKDEVIGVLQLINAKRDPSLKLTSRQVVHREVLPFSERSQELASSLASQAAVALENSQLYREIENLFEGFVKASVLAIESRDPTTFGHSERVAKLTVGLAEAVDRSDTGPYGDIHFTGEDIREIRYASILHDFGKVGVKEEVLVKAKKLYPSQLELIHKRFQYIRKVLELDSYRKKLDFVLANGNQNYQQTFAEIESAGCKELGQLEEFLSHILQANEPTVLPEKTSEELVEIAGWTFQDPSGPTEPLLSEEELRFLTIPKGSLDSDERIQIESHVIHSFRFLSQIPWTKELKRIPLIAKAHHEKLDGSGYPYHMASTEIPFQAKMMTISDIFDALTARDRPYKRAVPVERALDIIGQEVKSQLLDPVLFRLFVDAKIFQITAKE
ncbi:MAG: GAF domain-containing protein [Acidobacteriia bacterium]|nr:GAF domain-containing protein [Terriglobia bacterium]